MKNNEKFVRNVVRLFHGIDDETAQKINNAINDKSIFKDFHLDDENRHDLISAKVIYNFYKERK